MAKNPPRKFWLLKTEPDTFSIQDLAAERGRTTCWDGVRNYQARNFLRDEMKTGDGVLLYHSSTDPPAVVGTAVVVREGYPDHTAWQKGHPHFDADATSENPRWFMVDIRLERIFKRPIPRDELRQVARLKDMELLRKGSRLSVQPVRPQEFEAILEMTND